METYDRYKIIESALKQNWQRNVAEENSCMCDRNFVCVIISPQKWCVISVFTTNASYASPLFYLLSLSSLSFLSLSLSPPSLSPTFTYTHIHSLSLSLYSLYLYFEWSTSSRLIREQDANEEDVETAISMTGKDVMKERALLVLDGEKVK